MEVHYIQFKESLRTRGILNLIMNVQEESGLSAHANVEYLKTRIQNMIYSVVIYKAEVCLV